MGWFDEQIKKRKRSDYETFEESFVKIAGSVTGRALSGLAGSSRQRALDAIGEILDYYHVKAREVPDSIEDLNEQLEYLLRPYGIMRRSVNLDEDWFRDAGGAMLGSLKEDNSVVALIPKKYNGYTFYNSKTGRTENVNRESSRLLNKEAIAFYKPFPLKKIGIGGLFRYILENVRPADVVLVAVMAFVITLVGMITPWLNKYLFSDVIESGNLRILFATTFFLLCSSLSAMIFGMLRSFLFERITLSLDFCVEAATMMRVLSLPASFFKAYSAGEISSRTGYVSSLCQMLINTVLSTGLTSLFSLMYLTQVSLYAPSLLIPSVIVTLTTVVISTVTTFTQMKISKKSMETNSKLSGMSYAMITGIQKIRLAGAEYRGFSRWGRLYAEASSYSYNPPMLLKISSVITTAIGLIGTIVIYYTAVINGVSLSEYYAFNAAYGMVSGAFTSLAGIVFTIAQIKPVLEMAKPILDAEPEISEEKHVVTELHGGIEVNHVSFRYNENMPLILDDFSLKIKPGQYVAVVGKTGCGKSTLMRILLGFETPQKGSVYFDNKDIASLDLKSLRRKIGTVMQNGKLFSGDIYSNIVISAPWLSVTDAWEAAENAGIANDIHDMPMGMYTLISEGQGGISGGQRQRIMIARAIAPKPRILMFDEATSALDNLTQKKVSDSLDSLKCTRIVIAHRLSTIRHCDRIIVLEGGKIIEDGTYEELIARKGFFSELVRRQRLDTNEAEN
ncbi:MAG: NHLP bacteriocin export ABC transporter permease/ATPase subunit [Lachnospiraceae bacterium]|nr:NHLP bacteriocin export ABC transporter permease/ATPase subunit [Lachnospiraceae bacterium]